MVNQERFISFLENFSASQLDQLSEVYADDIDFKDPLNEAQGITHFLAVERDTGKQLKEIRFEIISSQGDETECFVSWVMNYRFRFWQREIEGASHVKFNEQGRVNYQRDYWDASLPVYGEFPPLGWIMKLIKRMISVKG